ncbi:MAG: glycosyltransferase [Clostridiales bacterium]|nr:glycosyltransferase [Clostridiales bacterium]
MDAKRKYAIKNKCPGFLWKSTRAVYRKVNFLRCRMRMTFGGKKMEMYCPCCGTKLKSFVEGDYQGRPGFYDLSLFENTVKDVLCPACGSLPRHRILAMWGEKNIDLLSGKDVLYFAPERGMTHWMKKNGIAFTTADLQDEDTDLQLDITDTGLPGGSYDAVICNHVLEHVDSYEKALAEVKRILRPGGIFIVSFPMSPDVDLIEEDPEVTTDDERLRRYGQSDHVRLFGRNADQLLKKAGYEVSVIDGSEYPGNTLPVSGPSKYDINRLFLCRKETASSEGSSVLSIIVPIYNVEKYLRNCIDSLLSSDEISKTEILLIDDGSTDGSGAIARSYADEYMFIRYFSKTNGGLSDARNYGLSQAKGKYVFFLDADDMVTADGISKVIRKASDSDADVILWDGIAIDESGKTIASSYDLILTHDGLPEGPMTGIDAMTMQIKDHGKACMTVWLRACRRDFLLSSVPEFQHGILHEDELWTPQVMTSAKTVDYLPEKVYCYRVRENSIMHPSGKDDRHVHSILYIMAKLHTLYDAGIRDKKTRKVLLSGWADTYLFLISKYDFERYASRKDLPRGKIVSASKHGKTKVKALVLRLFGVKIYRRMFRKR